MSTVTAFEAAITAGDLTKVARALDRGQDVNARLSSGRTPCHVAAMLGHKDLVQLLLDRDANIEATDEVRAQRDAGPLPVSPAREQSETASTPAWRAAAGLVTARRAGGATDGIDRAVVDRAVVGRGLRRAGRSAGDAGETGRAGMPGASHRAVMGRRAARVGGALWMNQARANIT
mmetsp:Transcript_18311/g.69316  ORF Transcript_18311/g.69316 Transcript_18311/m.69316 type:complete len:176 (-) Transcript_18311:286-813(-)